jgi:CO/xanthine dehydrogenase Mo-binding subunit
MSLSRRRFLKALGWTTAGLTVVAGGGMMVLPALPHFRAPTPVDAAAWLSLRPDGTIELVLPRAEIGQGISIALCQIVAEEVDFPLERIVPRHPTTERLPPVRATVGSDSITIFGPLLAQAAAALAKALRAAGMVAGEIPGGDWAKVAVPPRLITADEIRGARPRSFEQTAKRRVGQDEPICDLRAIVSGESSLYADDIRLPGMIFAMLVPTARLGATIADVDTRAARDVAGFLETRQIDGRLYVLAESRSALERCLSRLSVGWAGGTVAHADIDRAIDVDAALAQGLLQHVLVRETFAATQGFDIDIRLDVPMAAHAAMEPRTAVAVPSSNGGVRVWTGTQDVSFVHATLCKWLGLSSARVVVHGCRVGGGFGGKTTVALEHHAALLAQEFSRPVKVQWTREAEFREGFHRPPSSHRIRAALAADGSIAAWHHAFRSGHVIFTSAAMGPVLQAATSVVGDPGVARGARPPYRIERQRIEFEDVRLPVHTGPWRGLGAAPNSWAIETAIDALARHHGLDPFALRRHLLTGSGDDAASSLRRHRLRTCLDVVTDRADWSTRQSDRNIGYGLACGIYKEMSYAAVVAEVVRDGARAKVRHLWCAHDCGQMINPGQVRAQVEGNLVWGLGMALHENLEVAEGHIGATSYADYQVPRFSDTPSMTIDLLASDAAPSGAGETAIVAATAAITNAIAAMTGQIVQRLPCRTLP